MITEKLYFRSIGLRYESFATMVRKMTEPSKNDRPQIQTDDTDTHEFSSMIQTALLL